MEYQELLNEARILRDRALVIKHSDPALAHMLRAQAYSFEYIACMNKKLLTR